MKFEKNPDSFQVEELISIKLGQGKYYCYLMEKKEIDTPNAIKIIEKENNTKVYYSGLKDSNAFAKQYICSETELKTEDKKIALKFIGKTNNKIKTGDHKGNRFTIKITEIKEEDKKKLKEKMRQTFPNYFDDQRFNKKTLLLGRALKNKEWEKACLTALTEHLEFESEKSKEIKKEIKENWKNWGKLANSKTIPEIKIKIFEQLLEKENFEKATKMLEPKTLKISAWAGQSEEFNKTLSEYLLKQKNRDKKIIINEEKKPFVFSHKGIPREMEIQPIFPIKNNLKRKTYFKAKNIKIKFKQKEALIEFEIPKGSYATILIKCLLSA